MTTHAAIYCRISDDREGRAVGVDRQRRDCEALAEREGMTVVGVYVDNDRSASTRSRKKRPKFEEMITMAERGAVGAIVAYSTSRLTRRPMEHERLIPLFEERGIQIRTIKSGDHDYRTARGRRAARDDAARDAQYAEEISENVARAALGRAQASEFHGGPRGYGIAPGGTALVDDEADRIREWAAHVMAGGQLGTLARRLNTAGLLTPGGHEWKPWVIRRILLAPRIAGLRVVDGAEYQASNPEIVKPDVWRALTTRLTDPARRTHMEGPARKHIGTGLYICDRCDLPVRATYHAHGHRIYSCPACYRSWRADLLDDFVIGTLEVALTDEDRRRRLLPRAAAGGPDLGALRAEARAIGENLDALAVSFVTARGRTLGALQAGVAEGERRLAEIEQHLAAAGRADGLTAVLTADNPVVAFRDLDDLARKQAVVRGFMMVRLGPPIRGRATWAPEKFLGASRWVGDDRTWGEHWVSST